MSIEVNSSHAQAHSKAVSHSVGKAKPAQTAQTQPVSAGFSFDDALSDAASDSANVSMPTAANAAAQAQPADTSALLGFTPPDVADSAAATATTLGTAMLPNLQAQDGGTGGVLADAGIPDMAAPYSAVQGAMATPTTVLLATTDVSLSAPSATDANAALPNLAAAGFVVSLATTAPTTPAVARADTLSKHFKPSTVSVRTEDTFTTTAGTYGGADSTVLPSAIGSAGTQPLFNGMVRDLLAQKTAHKSWSNQPLQATHPEPLEASPLNLPASVAMTDATLTFFNGADWLRSVQRSAIKSKADATLGSDFEGIGGQSMGTSANRADAVFQVVAPSATVPDTAVAETLTYWASHGVQSAQLTLEGVGESPVEVSISVNGDQTHIDFRTDQPGLRLVLENATTQLKDMLQSQGLQLAGVSIGASGAGGQAPSERRSRPGGQSNNGVQPVVVEMTAPRVRPGAAGRSLDLFV